MRGLRHKIFTDGKGATMSLPRRSHLALHHDSQPTTLAKLYNVKTVEKKNFKEILSMM